MQLVRDYRATGWKIELSLGLHDAPPDWALKLEPWTDQDGATYLDGPNWFNPTIQQEIASYIGVVMQTLGPDTIDAVRIGGTSAAGEIDYPLAPPPYKYTAYSASALAGTPLIAKNPVPQCKPPSCTASDAATFYAWYVTSLAAFCNFQVDKLRAAGFQGDVQWLMGGGGVTPALKSLLLSHGLAPTADLPDDSGVSAAGLDEPVLIAQIASKDAHTVITNTGINDSTTLGANETSTDVEQWSAPHWTAYNADLYHLRKTAENVGFQNGVYDTAADMQRAFAEMTALGYGKLMWAFDTELRTAHGATIDDYARNIAQAR